MTFRIDAARGSNLVSPGADLPLRHRIRVTARDHRIYTTAQHSTITWLLASYRYIHCVTRPSAGRHGVVGRLTGVIQCSDMPLPQLVADRDSPGPRKARLVLEPRAASEFGRGRHRSRAYAARTGTAVRRTWPEGTADST